ncbi:MAG: hypothetical protein RIS73_213 [Bacteroidota bacterium]|jgi:hypothetical protein
MKNLVTVSVLFVSIVFLSCFFSSCAKPDTSSDKPKEEQVIGSWSVNRIQLKIFYNGVFFMDTIIPRAPKPKNFVEFGNGNSFKYCFNSTTINNGTYQFAGSDSLISTTPSNIYRWKMLTLTDVLFTVMNTSTNDPAYPGATVETYQTFVR